MLGTRYMTKIIESHEHSSLPLATTYRGEACCCNPVWSSVRSHTEHAVIDCRVIHFLLVGDGFPLAISAIKPDVVDVGHPVVVNVELANFWRYLRWWRHDIVCGGGSIPGSNSRRAGAKWSLLFERRWHRHGVSGVDGVSGGLCHGRFRCGGSSRRGWTRA